MTQPLPDDGWNLMMEVAERLDAEDAARHHPPDDEGLLLDAGSTVTMTGLDGFEHVYRTPIARRLKFRASNIYTGDEGR